MGVGDGEMGEDEEVLYDARCSLGIFETGLLSHDLTKSWTGDVTTNPLAKPKNWPKMTFQCLQVVPRCRSASWLLSGSLWWVRHVVKRWHDHGTLGRKSMSLSDWETMWFELEEKYMPIWVNVPALWLNYQMKKRKPFFLFVCFVFLANFVLLSLLECYLLKSLPCLSMGTCAEETKRNELTISSVSQWIPYEETHLPHTLTFTNPPFLWWRVASKDLAYCSGRAGYHGSYP